MSGIVAIVNFDGAPVDPEVLRKMAEQCAYRGPDGIRYWIRGNVGLAHLALHATPEALRELQPQLSEDGTLCLTADVRVDNRPELINLLNAKGTPLPADATDADLLLAAYRTWSDLGMPRAGGLHLTVCKAASAIPAGTVIRRRDSVFVWSLPGQA